MVEGSSGTVPTTAPATTLPDHDTITPAPGSSNAQAVPNQQSQTQDPTQPPQPTLKQRLDAAEHLWSWKLGLRVVLILLSIIGTGAVAWAYTSSPTAGLYDYSYSDLTYGDSYGLVWAFITFGVTFLWCSICVLVLLLRRPNKPVHPGVAVAMDLLLWLAYIPTAMLLLFALSSLKYYGSYGRMGSSPDAYVLLANGTWVWEAPEPDSSVDQYCDPDSFYYDPSYCDSYSPPERRCNSTSSSSSTSYYTSSYFPQFTNCAEEEAWVNDLWAGKPHRVNVETLGVVCQFICLVLHIALMAWACVDTHRYNKSKVGKDAEKLAGDIVMNMIRTGAVVPNNGSVAMQQPLLARVQPHGQSSSLGGQPGQVPMGWVPQQGFGGPVQGPQPVVLAPEKGESPRFA